MRPLLSIAFFIAAWPFALCSQDVNHLDFLEKSAIASTEQWLSSEFQLKFPAYFEYEQCPPSFQSADPNSIRLDMDLGLDPQSNLLYTDLILDIWLNADCERFMHVKALSDLYFPLFDKKINSLGLHADYKYLPVVMSAMNAGYTSGSRSGLWQLDYVIARKYKLEIDREIDQRNAADLSTDAALTHLLFLEKKYNQDYAKVLLAFMGSVPLVEQYMKEAEESGKPFIQVLNAKDKARLEAFYTTTRLFKSLETKNALFDYIALLNNYENFVFDQEVTYDALVHMTSDQEDELRGLNPVYVSQSIPANYRDVPFIVSIASAKWIRANSDSLYSWSSRREAEELAAKQTEVKRLESGIPEPGTFDEIHYTVRQGDVLGVIASKFGVRVSQIRDWNNLCGDMIYAGQGLVIYGKKGKKPATKPQPEAPEKKTPTPATGKYITYTVKSGESLWLIARKFPGVSSENIMEWNDCDENIRPGQQLKIYNQ